MTRGPDEFYVGYLPEAPSDLARWVRGRVILLLTLALGVAALLTLGQADPGPALFEFGVLRRFEGDVALEPVPHLVLERPRDPGQSPAHSRYLLSSFGKRGAAEALAPHAGRRVALAGSLIHRAGRTMIELAPDEPIHDLGPAAAAEPEQDLGRVTLRGEIVDSKCHWGVMKPGEGKPHRGCAVRCIAGGVPPVLLIREADGPAKYVLLAREDGSPVNDAVLDLIAEPVEITGRLARIGDLFVLRSDPLTYRRP